MGTSLVAVATLGRPEQLLRTVVYVVDVFVALGRAPFERLLGLAHLLTGAWLMYLTLGSVLDIASGTSLPAG